MLGMTAAERRHHHQTERGGHDGRQFRERGNEYPRGGALRESDREAVSDVGLVLLRTPGGQGGAGQVA
jgi:hypothetical protein